MVTIKVWIVLAFTNLQLLYKSLIECCKQLWDQLYVLGFLTYFSCKQERYEHTETIENEQVIIYIPLSKKCNANNATKILTGSSIIRLYIENNNIIYQ